MRKRIAFIGFITIIINVLEEGIIGRNGEGGSIADLGDRHAFRILIGFRLAIHMGRGVIEGYGSLCPRTPHPSHHQEKDEGMEEVAG